MLHFSALFGVYVDNPKMKGTNKKEDTNQTKPNDVSQFVGNFKAVLLVAHERFDIGNRRFRSVHRYKRLHAGILLQFRQQFSTR